jgi:hypothetical protein
MVKISAKLNFLPYLRENNGLGFNGWLCIFNKIIENEKGANLLK